MRAAFGICLSFANNPDVSRSQRDEPVTGYMTKQTAQTNNPQSGYHFRTSQREARTLRAVTASSPRLSSDSIPSPNEQFTQLA
jgi:hypothetical protein